MKATLLALVIGVSVSAWSYTKLQRQAGSGNTTAALKGTLIIFVITFIVAFTLGRSFLH